MNDYTLVISDTISKVLSTFMFLVLYEVIAKRVLFYFRYRKIRGTYVVCNSDFKAIVSDGRSHTVEIDFDVLKKNLLKAKGQDFINGIPKKWDGEILINDNSKLNFLGHYRYEGELDSGSQYIYMIDDNVLTVRIAPFHSREESANIWVRKSDGRIKY